MGLTIHYTLHMPQIKSAAGARAFLKKLQAFAKTLPVNDVSKIVSWKPGDEPLIGSLHEFPIFDKDQASDADVFFAKPLEMFFFIVRQPGSEPAVFGLGRFGKTARSMQTGATRASDLSGWNWHHSCKTQYASMSNEGGWPNFFAIHDGICKVLDHAVTLGAQLDVLDESKYWEHRDPARLQKEIGRWNAMIAAVVGVFKDRIHGDSADAAPILGDPEFEHLEAKGQDFLRQPMEIKIIRNLDRPRKRRRRKS